MTLPEAQELKTNTPLYRYKKPFHEGTAYIVRRENTLNPRNKNRVDVYVGMVNKSWMIDYLTEKNLKEWELELL